MSLQEFIEKSTKLIGKEAEDHLPVNHVVTRRTINSFSSALGMDNVLWDNPGYALASRFGSLLAPQTYLSSIRWPVSDGDYKNKDYSLAKFCTAVEFEWFDVIRCGDTFTTELKLTDICEKTVEDKQVVDLVSEASYFNRGEELVGAGTGTMTMIPIKRGEEMFSDREIYEYSQEEIDRIAKDIDSGVSRGDATLFWEDMNEGDTLPQVVKGPANLPDIYSWRGVTKRRLSLEIGYKQALIEPGNRRVNPTTNWPYFHADNVANDINSVKLNGMPQPYVHGLAMASMSEDLLQRWMSVDGFIRKLNFVPLKPFIYGDTNWYSGTVVEKYKEKLNGVIYYAADIAIDMTNQMGEKTGSGDATIYLASRGHEVTLPVPNCC